MMQRQMHGISGIFSKTQIIKNTQCLNVKCYQHNQVYTLGVCHSHSNNRRSNLPSFKTPFAQQSLLKPTKEYQWFHTSASMRKETSNHGLTQAEREQLISSMNIRLVSENGFLSWCRNAYMSTVVGVAMMSDGLSALAQSAGLGALLVASMNLGWGTACHLTNLYRLRHVSGMSSITLFLHMAGSALHFMLWGFVLICFIGFLDEGHKLGSEGEGSDSDQFGDGLPNRSKKV